MGSTMSERGYQKDYSEIVPTVLDEESRRHKAEKILCVLSDYLGESALSGLRCLDSGCSGGIIDAFLAEHFNTMVGIDIDEKAIRYANKYRHSDNMDLFVGSAICLPFEKDSFEVVICNHVYAHVSNPMEMMKEIYRVLKPGGICYFAGANKYSVMEGNYKLPFLSWLPLRIAGLYLKILRGIPFYYERHLSLPKLKQLVKDFHILDYTLKIIADPGKYGYARRLERKIPVLSRKLAPALYPMIPTYIWLLIKQKGDNIK